MKIGLALGGGGARGIAHIGVIKALQELRIPIHCVAGTSIGAIVGGAYAAGAIDRAYKWVSEPNWRKLPRIFVDLHLSKKALIRGERIERFLRNMLPVSKFEELLIPFAAVATDLMSAEAIVLRSGDLCSAIRASMAVPGVFSPINRDGRVLIDGGLVDPLPVKVCADLGADMVIAVDLNNRGSNESMVDYPSLNVFSVIDETFRIVMNVARQRSLNASPSIMLTPSLLGIRFFDFHKARRIVEMGYAHAMRMLEDAVSDGVLVGIQDAADPGESAGRK